MRKEKLMEENSIFIFQESLVRGGKASSVTVAPTRKKNQHCMSSTQLVMAHACRGRSDDVTPIGARVQLPLYLMDSVNSSSWRLHGPSINNRRTANCSLHF
jgi:hypothetical protein